MVPLSIEDVIPEGTFHSGLSKHQINALMLVKRIGEKLASIHPEIAQLYRQGNDFRTYVKIARQYIADAKQFPQVASKAVGYAIRKLMPSEELQIIRMQRRTEHLEGLFDGFDSEKFKEHCRKAAKKRHESGIGVDTMAMISARGRTPWTEDEKRDALRLSNDPIYQHQVGSQRGRPYHELIALELNIQYHNCKEVRHQNSVASYIRDTRRKK